jgi:hypothetical protein
MATDGPISVEMPLEGYRNGPEYSAVGYLRELIDCGAIEPNVFAELMKTPRMKQILQGTVSGVVQLREYADILTHGAARIKTLLLSDRRVAEGLAVESTSRSSRINEGVAKQCQQ